MQWDYCFKLYLERHCTARGLQAKSIAAYRDTLIKFREFVRVKFKADSPEKVTSRDILEYVEHLRKVRNNQNSAVNRAVTIIRSFYRAIVAMEYMEPRDNPMVGFPIMKAPKRKFRDTLTIKEAGHLINMPATNTVIGLRDRAILTLLYGTGIRASECANLKESDVRLDDNIIRVVGKGGDQRTLPLGINVALALEQYKAVRGKANRFGYFFISRNSKGIARNTIYMRVKKHTRLSKISKHVTPHTLRHTFATHLIQQGENIVVVRDLLGHRQLSSTQVYLHMTAVDIRAAIDRHPIRNLLKSIKNFFPESRFPFQYPPGKRFVFS